MTAIIFGANGQDGSYLTDLLLKKHYQVIGIVRRDGSSPIDITNYVQVSNLVKEHQPHFIFHLAANSTTRHDALFENHQTIATGTITILEAVKNFSPHTKVFLSGSGLQFKNENKPIKETDEFEARDAYSVSRIQSVFAARYFRSLGLRVYVGYFFNHDSPLRSERHMAQKIAAAAKRIARGSKEKIEIGDISVIKEWAFAGDIVKGIWQLVTQDNIHEANISSGAGYSIEDWVKKCFEIIDKDYHQHIVEVSGFTSEYQQLVSDPSLINSIGFKTETSFDQLAQMMIDG